MRSTRDSVLAAHRYYWPDTPPYASILQGIAGAWASDSKVEVITAQPSYKSVGLPRQPRRAEVGGVHVRRLGLSHEAGKPIRRIWNTARLGWSIFWSAASGRYDSVMVSTMPPVIPGLAAQLGTRISGARLIYHCMDLYPEIGRLSGDFRNPLLFRILLKLDAATCRAAEPVVVLSEDMAATIRSRPGCANAQIRVINNFALPSTTESAPSPLPERVRLRVLFAGNVGRFQGLEATVEALHRRARRGTEDIEVVIMGSGASLPRLQRLAADGPARHLIQFIPHQAVEVAKAAMRDSDVGLVALMPGIYRYAFPSKTMTYLEQGLPVLVVVEEASRLAQTVNENRIGWAIRPGDPRAYEEWFDLLARNREALPSMASRAHEYAAEQLDEDRVLNEWRELLRAGRRSRAES